MRGIVVVGAGRIGRLVIRECMDPIVGLPLRAIVDVEDPVKLAALLTFDTNYGHSRRPVTYRDGRFDLGEGLAVPFYRPGEARYDELGAEVVIEATGRARDRRIAEQHLELGAAHVLVTAPPRKREDADAVLLYEVNHREFDPARHRIVSNASCTTNCLVHVVLGLREAGIEIRSGFFNTVHSVTSSQRLVDAPAADLCDSWSGFQNIIVSETGAAAAIGMLFPEYASGITGQAARVPTGTVSLLEGHFHVPGGITEDRLREAYEVYASTHPTAFALEQAAYLPSRAFAGNPHSCIVVVPSLAVRGELARVVAWYDNEHSYARRLMDLSRYMLDRVA